MADQPSTELSSAPGALAGRALAWAKSRPLDVALVAGIALVLTYFYGFYNVFMNGNESTAVWAWRGWNDENDQVHCVAIPFLVLWLLWQEREKMAAAEKQPAGIGLVWLIAGVFMFVLGARCLQPRFALISVPMITYGAALWLWGRAVARSFVFPCVLMLFTLPMGGLIQSTINLQLFASSVVGTLCKLLGIQVVIIGTTITVDGAPFEVAGGCSGIRSLMAMSMLAALYVHWFVRGAWRKLTIFGCSIVFALIGNVARLFTVILLAKWWDPKIAGGLYHDYSGFVFFPIAVAAMIGASELLDFDVEKLRAKLLERDPSAAKPTPAAPAAPDVETKAEAAPENPAEPQDERRRKSSRGVSYDY